MTLETASGQLTQSTTVSSFPSNDESHVCIHNNDEYILKCDSLKALKFEVYYMDMRARAEIPRILLEYVGANYWNRFPGDWANTKSTTTHFGYLPHLTVYRPDGSTFELSEVKAITRYLAKLFELDASAGSASAEANAKLDMLFEGLVDNTLSEMKTEIWGKPDPLAPASFQRYLDKYHLIYDGLERFLVQNGSNGYFHGTRTTYPDLAYFEWLSYFYDTYPEPAKLFFSKDKRPASWALFERLQAHPRLQAYIQGGRGKFRTSSPFLELEHVQFLSQDWEKTHQFYSEVLGLRTVKNFNPMPDMAPKQRWLEYELLMGSSKLAIFAPGGSSGENDPFKDIGPGMIMWRVKSVSQVVANLKKKGVTFEPETMKTPIGWIAKFKDPDGNMITILEPSSK